MTTHFSKEIVGCVSGSPWFSIREGNEIRGFLMNFYDRPHHASLNGMMKFGQVLTTKPTEVRDGMGEDARHIRVPSKTVVNVNMASQALLPLVGLDSEIRRGAVYYVHIRCGKKVPLSGCRSMYLMDVRTKVIRQPFDETRSAEAKRRIGVLNRVIKKLPLGSSVTELKITRRAIGSLRGLVRSLEDEVKAVQEGEL